MDLYPRMLYKFPGAEEIHGARFDTLIVLNEDDHVLASMAGWSDTTDEAKNHGKDVKIKAADETVFAKEYHRDALKSEAIALGLEFPKNIPTDKLAELVEQEKSKG